MLRKKKPNDRKPNDFRVFFWSFLLGAGIAAYGTHNYDYSLNDDLSSRMTKGGWCLDADPRGVAYLFACRDEYHAAQLQHYTAEDQTALDALVERTSSTQKKAKKR